MNHALHLKYRPKTLEELVGQPTICTTLTNAIESQQIAPAYLFTGPRGTGKTSTARIVAKSLNCSASKSPTANPCGECTSCRAISHSNSLDVSEIDAASHNGVDDARELIEHSNFAPAAGRYRLFILDEAHMLTSASQNALLKVIEEPPPRVVFILCTTEAHKVLPTIISRCQTFNFKALSIATIVETLERVAETEGIEITTEALNAIARTVNGGLRDALQLLSQLRLLGERITPTEVIEVSGGINPDELFRLLTHGCNGNTLATLQIARSLIDSGKSPQLILSSLLQLYRDLLLVKAVPNCEKMMTSCVSYGQLRSLANTMSFDSIHSGLTQLQKSEWQLKSTTNAATWLEVCLLNLRNDSSETLEVKSETNLAQIWSEIIESAKASNRGLLSQAELTQLSKEKAVLMVDERYRNKFQKNTQTLERIISKGLGYSVGIEIQS